VLVPRFDRTIEESVAGAIRIGTTTELVITEGNYLLLPTGHWADVAPLLDDRWLLQPDDDVRRARLVARHVAHGRAPADARAWVDDVDEPNARLVSAHRHAALLVLDPEALT
jgi:pantothenate kinase